METDQLNLFASSTKPFEKITSQKHRIKPLAHRLRPSSLEDFIGGERLFKKYPFLNTTSKSIIFWGPPGSGKTTLASLLASKYQRELYTFNAVLSGVADLKKIISRAQEIEQLTNKPFIIFIDEIHRFNKAQQDALLPYVEQGDFILFGATTENPKRSINSALLSRVQIVELKGISKEDLILILQRASQKEAKEVPLEFLELIAQYSESDARRALGHLEILHEKEIKRIEILEDLLKESARLFDRNGNRHYDVISAFIKSLRGSDANAAILWLAVMLDGGEDPVFIARRLIILASEDIGNADPHALLMAQAALSAVSNIGMPEARITLAQVTLYLALAPKSNACYSAINQALEFVRNHPTIEVPTHLRNEHPDKALYLYPHNFPNSIVKQDYTGLEIPQFYKHHRPRSKE